MKIVIMGSGGVGGYFGARLADAGEDLSIVERGRHLDAIKSKGLKIKSELGNTTIDPALASDIPEDLGMADFILFCVKAYDTESAALAIKPLVGPKTGIIPFLNGIEHIQILRKLNTSVSIGFEPMKRLLVCYLSKVVHSTTLPTHQRNLILSYIYRMYRKLLAF